MKLLDQIKKDRLKARKDGDATKVKILTTLLGDAENQLKGPNAKKFTTVGLIKKYVKNLNEIAVAREKSGHDEYLTVAEFAELAILEGYLPQVMSLQSHEEIVAGLDKSLHMGVHMKNLKAEFGDTIDLSLVRELYNK